MSAIAIDTPILFRLWAKTDPFHPLPCHLVDVGNVALQLLQTGPFRGTVHRFHAATGCPPDQVAAWLAYLTAMHDLGKCRADFQGKVPACAAPLIKAGLDCRVVTDGYRHEAMSAQWMLTHLIDEFHWTPDAAIAAADAIRGHHGNLGLNDPPDEAFVHTPQWEPLRLELEQLVRNAFAPPPWHACFSDHSAAGLLLAGLLVLSDWIASNIDLFPMQWQGETIEQYTADSRERAAAAVERLGLTGESPFNQERTFQDLWPKIPTPHPMQLKCQELSTAAVQPGLVIIEAPMGEGKSEAAIYWATQQIAAGAAAGIYIALPTAATSNQMFGRFQAFLQQHDATAAHGIRLVHGTSWLIDAATPNSAPELSEEESSHDAGQQALDWFRPRKRSLLATYGVGTIDQALMAALHVKHGFLRLYGLSGKVLVIDEVHAYDAYMSRILTLLLQWCRVLQVPVILLSATLPQERRQALVAAYHPRAVLRQLPIGTVAPYPLLTLVQPDGHVREEEVAGVAKESAVQVRLHWGLLGDAPAVAQVVADRARQGGCFCVIANTVDSAQAIYSSLQGQFAGEPVKLLLFHARFPVAQRQAIEEEVLRLFDKRSLPEKDAPARTERPTHAILVATQVVEQSLDLDFDEMFTEVAPIDLLLQRTGRLHRHPRSTRRTGPNACLHVLLPTGEDPAFGPSGKVYQPYILLRTLLVLRDRHVWQLPSAIRPLIEAVYDDRAVAGFVDAEQWAAAKAQWQGDAKQDEREAKQYLIARPRLDAFSLVRSEFPYDENEDSSHSYFDAKTRNGAPTVKLLLVEGDEWAAELARTRPPAREKLQAMHLQTASVPAWWVGKGVQPITGFAAPIPAPVWLPGTLVLRLYGGEWQGQSKEGKRMTIRVDPALGLTRKEG